MAINTASDAIAVAQVFLNTNTAAAGGVIGALLMSKLLGGKVDVTMAINGALAGLVAITAGPDTPAAGVATLIGFIGGIIVYFSVIFIDKNLKIDDPVGAISVHGVVGIWGILAVPLTSDATFGAQLLGIISIIVWTFVTSFIVLKILDLIFKLRPEPEVEDVGLDTFEIGVEAYPEFK